MSQTEIKLTKLTVPLQRSDDFGIGLVHLFVSPSCNSSETVFGNFFILYISVRYGLRMMHVFLKF